MFYKFQYQVSDSDQEISMDMCQRVNQGKYYFCYGREIYILKDIGLSAPEIGLLIVASCSGSLIAGLVVLLENNLVDIKIKLG